MKAKSISLLAALSIACACQIQEIDSPVASVGRMTEEREVTLIASLEDGSPDTKTEMVVTNEGLSNAKYEVTDVTKDKDSDDYTVQLTVYPLDTLETSYDRVVEYIESFNARVDDGDFNNTTEVDYETEFAEGIINILKSSVDNPGYMDPVVLEIPITPSDDYYYISDEDFLSIDKNILYIRENPSTNDTISNETIINDQSDSEEVNTDEGEYPDNDGSDNDVYYEDENSDDNAVNDAEDNNSDSESIDNETQTDDAQ
mgnify:CR=1 FL=1